MIIFKNYFPRALLKALESYIDDVVLLDSPQEPKAGEIQGWKVLTWENFSTADKTEPNTIIWTEKAISMAGIEATNVIFHFDPALPAFASVIFDVSCMTMLRAVAHLSVIIDEKRLREEKEDFWADLAKVSNVIRLDVRK